LFLIAFIFMTVFAVVVVIVKEAEAVGLDSLYDNTLDLGGYCFLSVLFILLAWS